MKFSFTEEQQEFRFVLRRFLQDNSPTTEVRRLMETDEGCDPDVWRQVCQDLGLTGVHIPEAYGGQGFGLVELGIVLEEMGRALLCSPYFASTVLAATAILNGGSEENKITLLPPIAAGEVVATLAFAEDSGRWDCESVEMTAESDGDGYVLSGHKSFVLDGCSAAQIVVAARKPGTSGDDGVSLFLVTADADGLSRKTLKSMDPTRKLARLEFNKVAATLLGEEGAAASPLEKTIDQAALCLASEMVGGADILRESAVEYSLLRVQFGRAVGSFQAIKHKAADMLLEVEMAKAAAYYAAGAHDEGDADWPAMASLAKASAGDAYMQAAIHTVQMHGGIGFTWDNDTHLWFKRAKSSEVFLGDSAHHRELMMQRWPE
ncbi:MAG: alkylation response protein AidB-like acyl-CoA dehydrogenase [Alphaproteobacteria bacterium]|jgi:alkylation response protein AidB-like acyl-CoA dehydrogenase